MRVLYCTVWSATRREWFLRAEGRAGGGGIPHGWARPASGAGCGVAQLQLEKDSTGRSRWFLSSTPNRHTPTAWTPLLGIPTSNSTTSCVCVCVGGRLACVCWLVEEAFRWFAIFLLFTMLFNDLCCRRASRCEGGATKRDVLHLSPESGDASLHFDETHNTHISMSSYKRHPTHTWAFDGLRSILSHEITSSPFGRSTPRHPAIHS